jgi:murein DD-endopeptidase MepM/ murein hydrolase activator NlpD
VLGIIVGMFALAAFAVGAGEEPASPTQSDGAVLAAQDTEPPAPAGPPTPYYASYRSLRLCLPVSPDAVTLLAFHQASGDRALHQESLVPDADMDALATRVADGDFPTSSALALENGTASEASAVWQGEALRLWRSNRSGPPDTAADVGAPPGTQVRAPVSGTVIAVRRYELYDRCEDFEIHIQPEGWPEVDVVLIHVADVSVSEGDQVLGGLTPIATVRHLSDKVDLQLGGYTGDGGDHVHVQLNELPDPAMLEYVGDS